MRGLVDEVGESNGGQWKGGEKVMGWGRKQAWISVPY
jgi:hypothetical protein